MLIKTSVYLAHGKIPSINAVIVIYSFIHQIFTTRCVRPWEFIMNKIDTFPPCGDCTYGARISHLDRKSVV